jgi:NAD(P)-dependent dehydrogenase (short-subunit alcohol dehydrogenase family)
MRLKGKIAMVTGAASGLGAATAKRLLEEGAKVCIADILEGEGRSYADRVGVNAFFQRLDVADAASWNITVANTLDRFGRLDILVNNAGIGPGTADLFDQPAWDRQLSINSAGPFLGIKSVVPAMRYQADGVIINISSIAAKVGQHFHLGYNASKAAILGLTKAAAIEFASDGIRVNAVLPGLMPPMRTSIVNADPSIRQRIQNAIPLGRIGHVSDVANAVLFLASDEASYITGVELPVDGGYLAQ